jgi:hypothetical protein
VKRHPVPEAQLHLPFGSAEPVVTALPFGSAEPVVTALSSEGSARSPRNWVEPERRGRPESLVHPDERAFIRGRTRAALAAKQTRGERVSRFPPIGAELNERGELVPAPAEVAAIELAIELAARGVPLRRIGAELLAAGHRPRGASWHLTTIARMVRRGGDVHEPSPSCTAAPKMARIALRTL